MSTLVPWIASAQEELLELEQQSADERLDPASAYRVLVLCARLAQARDAGWEVQLPSPWQELAARVAPTAARPDSRLLLSRLDSLLFSDDEPFGELFDVLLAVDDMASVDEAQGRAEDARELAHMADAFVSLARARVRALVGPAEHRLETLPSNASIRMVWSTVARVATEAASQAQPDPGSLARRRLLARLRKLRVEEEVSEAPAMVQLAAAAAADVHSEEQATFEGREVGVYIEGDQIVVQVELPTGMQAAGDLRLRIDARERSTLWRFPIKSDSRRAIIAHLGTLQALRERLSREGVSLPSGELRVMVELELKEAEDGGR